MFIDGHDSHWDIEAIKWLKGQHVHVLFLKSNDSINDQANDNGPNAALRRKYNDRYNEWRARFSGIAYNQSFFKGVIALAWDDFVKDSNTKSIIVEAFKKTRIYPLEDDLDTSTLKTDRDVRNAKLTSLFVTDDTDRNTIKIFSEQEIAKATVECNIIQISKLVDPTGKQPAACQCHQSGSEKR